ncbi:unnamed protein product [Bursaphelenchus xylophilus]|uniref:(pine wood nematode) hypothetical protein n=1 Tax=Bursaphelenchus xylophilus TaxID=6326 RepID=A0A1I7RWF5_BURXY|nr:unnamed protein product [Bursaphelenchus xylophilus]CAG9128327.1 unnamed protein product [Bursaphelenchus xylophilus]
MSAESSNIDIEFRFICDEELRNDEVPLVDGLIIRIPDRKLTSKVLNALPAMKEDVLHLKRVKNDTILVGVYSEKLEKEARDCIAQFPGEFVFLSLPIPSRSPTTRSQFESYKVYWPVHYREDLVLESKLDDTYFKAKIREDLVSLLDEASTSDGCVIADSSGLKVLARASEAEEKGLNPLRHPFMRALEKFCQVQRAKRKRSMSGDEYLCNNCYVIIENEPCAMCAMALVHSRTSAVIFKNPSSNGAFITNCQLHLNKKLNHHYDVYQVVKK